MNSNQYNKTKNNIKITSNIDSISSNEKKPLSSIDERINKIKELLDNSDLNKINPLKNMDADADTDRFEGTKELKDNKSYDSRILLGKKNQDFYDVLNKMNSELKYIKSGAYGNTFKATIYDEDGNEKSSYGFKVVAYTKKNGSIHDIYRPENAEINMLKLLSYFVIKGYTPHIILPLCIFNTKIDPFIKDVDNDVKQNEKYKEFLRNYHKNHYHSKVSVIISEWANRGDLGMFLKKHYERLELIHWKCLFFQIISTLAKIQIKYPAFKHNDLKANNILISRVEGNENRISLYSVEGNVYHVPGFGYMIYLWDFDFSCISGIVENSKVYQEWTQKMNITSNKNRYYDLHYFFCTLVYKGFLPDLFSSTKVPKEVKAFIKYVVPKQYRPSSSENGLVNKKCRLQVDDEYILPINLLKHDFFKEFTPLKV